MKIISGLMDNQVVQRNIRNVNETLLSVQSTVSGLLQVKVTKGNTELKGFNYKRIGKVKSGISNINLIGIPAGGPYKIVLRIIKTDGMVHRQVNFSNILVGDVWMLAGQSNMEGLGLLKNAPRPKSMVRAFYMDDNWAIAKDPIHNLCDSVDSVHTDINGGVPVCRDRSIGTGPGVSFAHEMLELSGIPQGIISCAHGGSNMRQWDPSLKKMKCGSLYGAMLRRFHKNGSNVAGVLWYQGESETVEGDHKLYTKRMKKLIASIRRDFSILKLPIIVAQLASFYRLETPRGKDYWNSVQEQQRLLPNMINKLTVVPTIDLELDDGIHISGISQIRLGRRLAGAAYALMNGRKGGKLPIQLKSIKYRPNRNSDYLDIEITYANIVERLTAMGRPTGFSLIKPNGSVFDAIYRTDVKDNKVILQTVLFSNQKYELDLYYGYGFSPYCNITDNADRSLPAFGPYRLPF